MAAQTIEFLAETGLTLTLKLFAFGSDTVVDSQSATERTNAKGVYTAAFTDVAAGTYRAIAYVGSTPKAAWAVKLTLDTATFTAYEAGVTGLVAQQITIDDIASNAASTNTAVTNTGVVVSASSISSIQSGLATAASLSTVASGITTLLTRIPSTLFSGITSLANWLGALAGKTADTTTRTEINATTAGATFDETADSLEAIRDRGDAAWTGGGGGAGSGAITYTHTVTVGGTPRAGVTVWVSTDSGGTNVVASGVTNDSGQVVFYLDAATYYIWKRLAGINFTNPETINVSA